MTTSIISGSPLQKLPIYSAKKMLSSSRTSSLNNYIKSGFITINNSTIRIERYHSLKQIAKAINIHKHYTKIEAKIITNQYGNKAILLVSFLPNINIIDHNGVLLRLYRQNLMGKTADSLIRIIREGPVVNQHNININYKLKQHINLSLLLLNEINKRNLSEIIVVRDNSSQIRQQERPKLNENSTNIENIVVPNTRAQEIIRPTTVITQIISKRRILEPNGPKTQDVISVKSDKTGSTTLPDQHNQLHPLKTKHRKIKSNTTAPTHLHTSKRTKHRKSKTNPVVNDIDVARQRREALRLMRLKNQEFLFKMVRVYKLTDTQRQEFGLYRSKESSVIWSIADKQKVERIYSRYYT